MVAAEGDNMKAMKANLVERMDVVVTAEVADWLDKLEVNCPCQKPWTCLCIRRKLELKTPQRSKCDPYNQRRSSVEWEDD